MRAGSSVGTERPGHRHQRSAMGHRAIIRKAVDGTAGDFRLTAEQPIADRLHHQRAGVGMVQAEQHGQIIAKVAGQEEVLADEVLAGLAHPLPLVGVAGR